MKFTFLTLFPSLIEMYFCDSILKRAKEKALIEIEVLDLRLYTQNRHKKVDRSQIGGGAGQVICADVINRACASLPSHAHIIFLTPVAPQFSQKDSVRLSKKDHIVLVCGRYEGFDERSIELWADEVFCIGDFILTGGELPALCLCDSISRQIDSVLGNPHSLVGESFESNLLEAPVFAKTLQKDSKHQKNPPPLQYSQGNHSRISNLKLNLSEHKTQFHRPDLFQKWKFSKD